MSDKYNLLQKYFENIFEFNLLNRELMDLASMLEIPTNELIKNYLYYDKEIVDKVTNILQKQIVYVQNAKDIRNKIDNLSINEKDIMSNVIQFKLKKG